MSDAKCSNCKKPWESPLKCPLVIYVSLVILGIVGGVVLVAEIPEKDKNGFDVTNAQRWISGTSAIIAGVGTAFAMWFWMRHECKLCNYSEAWLIFLVAILLPIISFFLVLIIMGAISGIDIGSLF